MMHSLPSQCPRHLVHGAVFIGVRVLDFFMKRKVERVLQEGENPNTLGDKVTAYTVAAVVGAAVGGLLKAVRTGTSDCTRIKKGS